MADLSIPNDFVADTDATAEDVNENFDAIETAYNGSIASILADNSSAGRIIVCNGSGVPQYVALSGDATINSSGALTLAANSVDSNEIAANAVGASEIGSLPSVRVRRDAAQAIPNETTTAITFPTADMTESWDTDTIHDGGTNTERLTFDTAGIYLVIAQVAWVPNSTGRRELLIVDQDDVSLTKDTFSSPSAAAVNHQSVSTLMKADAGDYATMQVWQNSGGSLNVSSGTPVLSAAWLGDG